MVIHTSSFFSSADSRPTTTIASEKPKSFTTICCYKEVRHAVAVVHMDSNDVTFTVYFVDFTLFKSSQRKPIFVAAMAYITAGTVVHEVLTDVDFLSSSLPMVWSIIPMP